jgi:hypothetical protein
MILRFVKIVFILVSFVFTTGFIPFAALLGPGLTIVSSGNIYKASAQFLIDHQIKGKTGKNSLTHVKEEMTKHGKKEDLKADLKKLIETRVKIAHTKIAHTKIAQQNEINSLNKDLIQLVEKRIKIVRKKLN